MFFFFFSKADKYNSELPLSPGVRKVIKALTQPKVLLTITGSHNIWHTFSHNRNLVSTKFNFKNDQEYFTSEHNKYYF